VNERAERGIAFRAFVPNAVTALALCFGLTGIRFGFGGALGCPLRASNRGVVPAKGGH
jgi:phosphatidylserine synthase